MRSATVQEKSRAILRAKAEIIISCHFHSLVKSSNCFSIIYKLCSNLFFKDSKNLQASLVMSKIPNSCQVQDRNSISSNRFYLNTCLPSRMKREGVTADPENKGVTRVCVCVCVCVYALTSTSPSLESLLNLYVSIISLSKSQIFIKCQ